MNRLIKASEQAIQSARKARLCIREGFDKPTAGMAPGLTQANMIALPRDWAFDFLLYAQRNAQSCPVLDVIDAGGWQTVLAQDADIRTDIPRYRVWQQGKLLEEVSDVTHYWQAYPDLVTFLLGCSFTFESALRDAGIEVRHITDGGNVPMFRTNRPCRPAGRLRGDLVVSMRPVAAERVADAVMISGRFPAVHGAPVHIGQPELLGIRDIMQPDFGDAVRIESGEIPLFWACGVTPQVAVMQSAVPFAITHAPGYMFISDVPDIAWQGV